MAASLLVLSGLLIPLSTLPASPPWFIDATEAFGLGDHSLGEKAAFGDLDGDGLPDLLSGGRVWWNRGGSRFEPHVAPGDGLLVDLDADGTADVVTISPPGVHFGRIADGRVSFDPAVIKDLPATVSRSAAALDVDRDGLLDLYLTGYENWSDQITYPDLMLRQVRPREFRCEIVSADRRARGVAAADFDEDGDADLYVSNYRLQPNTLLVNDGGGRLVDEAAARGAVATSPGFAGGHSIGACWGDFDGDGHLDLFAGNFAHVDSRGDQPKSRVLRNQGPEEGWRFEDLGERGIAYQESYASPAAGDIDNDGRLDLVFTTVYAVASFDRPNHTVVLRNTPSFKNVDIAGRAMAWSFVDRTRDAGLEGLPPTYQAAFADVDRDGRLDLVTAKRLFLNRSPREDRHWLEVHLAGDPDHWVGPIVGSRVLVRCADGSVLVREVQAGTGEGNSDSPIIHFGLGPEPGPVVIDVRWPDGARQSIPDVGVDQMVKVLHP